MPRPRLYDDTLRVRLIATAAERIAIGGVVGLSLREVAAACATSTNAVYTLFGGRDELVAAVVDAASEGFTAAQRAVPVTADGLADLVGLGHAYRAWVLEHPALYAALMGGRVPVTRLTAGAWTADPTCKPLLEGVRRALAAGQLAGADVETIGVTLWAGVHGMVSLEVALWADLPRPVRDERFEQHLFALACQWVTPGTT